MAADILTLDALTLRERIASGALSALDVAEAYIAQIAKVEPGINAWAWHDPEYVRNQARAMDSYRHSGRPLGALHGVPVGLKDIIDTAGIPTGNGCVLDAARVPRHDAAIVAKLKAAGAIILGKTITTELAFMQPGPTRNPHNPEHTPGGSSSGSAAAVAAAMVPLAVGTQTGGSIIRPASFCGVTGFKPSFGAIPRSGVLRQSQTLDTIGVFARTPRDAALLAEVLFGHDADDPDTSPAPHPRLSDAAASTPPVPPVLAFVRPPGWDHADPELHHAFEELVAHLGAQVFEAPLPPLFDQAAHQRGVINHAEMARNYFTYGRDGADKIGAKTLDAIRTGETVLARDYLAALDWKHVLNAGIDEILARCDAIVTPATLGAAPHGLEHTGDPIFNGLWTFAGTPAITLPVLSSDNGLPMGVQLVGPRGGDARLVRTAQWLWNSLTTGDET